METNDQLEPTVFVIFGGAGDLTWRKLVPALFDLTRDRSMPDDFSVIPGPKMHLRSVEVQFNYQDTFAGRSPDAYETLLWDVMKNDATLFMRAAQVEAAWRFLMPVLDVWAQAPPSDFPNYAAGTWGPEDVQGLLAQGHSWPLPTDLAGNCEKKAENS